MKRSKWIILCILIGSIFSTFPWTVKAASTTVVHFTIGLDDIGYAGDLENTHSIGNPSPLHPIRGATLYFFSNGNVLVKKTTATFSFSQSTQLFTSSLTLQDFPANSYDIYISIPGFLTRKIPSLFIPSNQIFSIPTVTLVNGDTNADNRLDILDFGRIDSCFGQSASNPACAAADLNDDGKIDGIDYNIFLREISKLENGDTIPSSFVTPTPMRVPLTPTPTVLPTPTAIPGPSTSIQGIIPLPASIHAAGGRFALTSHTIIYAHGSSEIVAIAQYLASKLRPATGFSLPIITTPPATYDTILVSLSSDSSLGTEGYNLTITQSGVSLTAYHAPGLFRGVQTLRQMLPASIDTTSVQPGPWIIATGVIKDYPRFVWRGMMLDVVRHFFSVSDVERLIDELAYYKINVLHLHLSDDQGWRLQILSEPKLTSNGPYYTQAQYAQVVAYAKQRYITIVPEFDMPGHSSAARNAYGYLNCGEGDNLCVGNNATYTFVNNVIKEVAALTPGSYIHIGGDESSLPYSLYTAFINRVRGIVQSNGKQMIGWDETGQASLGSNSAVQFWVNPGLVQQAVGKGSKVVMSPVCTAYIDFSYASRVPGGASWLGACPYLSVANSYNWNPSGYISGIYDSNILGVEDTLWAETVYRRSDIDYMTFPREIATAEVGWTPQSERSWADFKNRLGLQGSRLSNLGIHYYRSPDIPWK